MDKEIKAGTELGHYHIVSKIGEGGMGEVYLAQDSKLDRRVALKVLPEDVVADGERLRRFGQEARAASALNHPNILTIYEIGNVDGNNYIATEFVDGKTLRDLLRGGGLTLHQAIDIAVQAASALSAAHEAGIIHRDIKPENIMVRPDGLVKVLDFGLAKLSGQPAVSTGSEDATRAQVKTAPGVIMGTVQYMSPEQTRGKATDARSDIWSLGCVMYEMLGGRAPFSGETTADIIAEIVKSHPVPLTRIAPNVPERLDEIVSKTLEKDPDERYQSIKDLLIDLRRLKKKLDLDIEIDRSHAPISDLSTEGRDHATKAISAIGSDTIAGHTTISGAEAVTSTIKRHKLGAAAVFAVIAIILAGFGYGIYQFIQRPKTDQPRTTTELKTQRLTGDGKTRDAHISPDGKFLVYRKVEDEKESLWIKQIQANSNIEVVKPGELMQMQGLQFSPDGNFVYFNAIAAEGAGAAIYRVPTLGGSPVRALSDATNISFSSDGKQMAFGRFETRDLESSIYIADIDGSNQRKLSSVKGRQFFNSASVWSPDSKSLVVALGDDGLVPAPSLSLMIVSMADGSLAQLGTKRWEFVDSPVWHPANDMIMFIASENAAAPKQLWAISYPSGIPRILSNSLSDFVDLSITADGNSAVVIERVTKSSVWVSANTDANAAKQIMPAKGDTWGIDWTPDKRIVTVSNQSGDTEVWVMNADGSNAKQLTSDRKFKSLATVSPDGKYIVYVLADGGGQLVRIDINGGNLLQLTHGVGSDDPEFSHDGKWVIYSSWVDGKPTIMRVSVDGGEPQIMSNLFAIEARYSTDGKFFACFVFDDNTQVWSHIAIIPADGGEPVKMLPIPRSASVYRGPVWTPDDKGITFLNLLGEKNNLWVQPVDGGKAKQLTNFDQPVMARRAYSPDGKQIAIVRGEMTGNAVLITGFR